MILQRAAAALGWSHASCINNQSDDGDGGDRPRQSKIEDFDDILEIIGAEGPFQKFCLYGVLGPVSFMAPLFMFNIVFMVFEPDHWCYVPGRDNETDLETWKNLTLPKEVGPDGNLRFSDCKMYDQDRQVVQCQMGWEYDRSQYEDTMISEFNWVCDKAHYGADALTFASMGNALGTIILGQAADRFGRKPIFFALCFTNIFFRVSSLFVADNIEIFLLHQVMQGLAFPLTYIVSTMLVCEISGKAYRAWIYSFTWIMWILGFSSLPLLAWLTQTWFWMGLVTSAPGLILMLYWWVVPESPRWLVTQGKLSDAKKVLQDIARRNGKSEVLKSISLDIVLNEISQRSVPDDGTLFWVFKLFTKPRVARNTMMISLMWATNNMVNYGITLSTNTIPGNMFVNFFIVAITEMPAVSLGGMVANKLGRRWTQVFFYSLCGMSCIGAACGTWFLKNYYTVIASAVLIKFAITVTFLVLYIQVTEIFPTQLRSTGSGFASTIGSTVTCMAPYAIFLGKMNIAVPYLLLSGFSLMGGVAASFLPETLNRKLPESLEEADQLGRRVKEVGMQSPCTDTNGASVSSA